MRFSLIKESNESHVEFTVNQGLRYSFHFMRDSEQMRFLLIKWSRTSLMWSLLDVEKLKKTESLANESHFYNIIIA